MEIHATAVVSTHAELAPGVKVGPYSSIGDHVEIGRDTEIGTHVVIEGHTSIGENNRIYHFSSIGTPPQDVGYQGEDTRLIIGNGNVIREYVTVNRATTKEEWKTVVGDHNYIMAYAHIAHDCVLGQRVIMSHAATLGGHVRVGDNANLGAFIAVHQFVRIGVYAFVGAKSGIDRDVPPFMITAGPRAKLYGVNRKGLSRMGFPEETIEGLKKAYRIIFREKKGLSEGISRARKEITPSPELDMLLSFLEGSKRGVLR